MLKEEKDFPELGRMLFFCALGSFPCSCIYCVLYIRMFHMEAQKGTGVIKYFLCFGFFFKDIFWAFFAFISWI